MKIKKLTLYKTKLDYDYNNVIDSGKNYELTKREYKENILDAFYSPLSIYNGDAKSGREKDGELTISIARDYETLRNYNYAVIENENGFNFYFITSIDGENDSETPITFLSLKRDAWSNNIDIITDKTIEDRNNIIRSHRPRWYTDGGLFYPYYYITGDVKNVNKLSTVSFLFPNGSSSYVVWLGFRVSGDAYYGTVDAGGTQATGIPVHGLGNKFDAIAPVFYTPIAILNGFTDGIPNYIFNFTCDGTAINNSSTAKLRDIFDLTSDYFLEGFLTLHPPFSYSSNASSVTTSGALHRSDYGLFFSYEKPVAGEDGKPVNTTFFKQIYNNNKNIQIYYDVASTQSYKTLTYNYTNKISGFSASGSTGSKLFNVDSDYNEVKDLDPRIYCSPYVEIALKIGALSIPINIVYNRTQLKAVINNGMKKEPTITTYLNNQIISAYQNITNTGAIPTSGDKWQNTEMVQGLKATASVIQGIIGGIQGGGALGGVMGGLSSIWGASVNNALDTAVTAGTAEGASQPSTLSSDNIMRHVPQLIITQAQSQEELNDIMGQIYLYGYRYPVIGSVKSNNRIWFDYCQTENCILSEIPNNRDRKELENAFNRGITKWHYNDGFGINVKFDKRKNNIEREWVSAIDAQMAFKFFDSKQPLHNFGTSGSAITAELNSGILTEYGIEAKDNNNAIIIDHALSFGNYNVLQLKITKPPKKWSNCVIANFGNIWKLRTSATYNGFKFAYQDGDGTVVYNPANPDDIIGKTISIQYHTADGSYYSTLLKVYIDNTEVYSANFQASTSTWQKTYLMNNCEGMIMSAHYGTVLNDTVNDEWIAKHQIPGTTAPQYTVTIQYNAGADSKTDTMKKYMGTYTVGDLVNDIPANYDIETITVNGEEKTLADTITITGNTVITVTCKKSYELTTTANKQYINTLITPRPGIRVRFNCKIGYSSDNNIFGAIDDTVANRFNAYLYTTTDLYYYTSAGFPGTNITAWRDDYNEYETKADGLYINGIRRIEQTAPINAYNLPIYIFNCNKNNSRRGLTNIGTSMKFFYIYDSDGTLLFKGDAAEDNNGTPCMYDSISNKYFYLDGTNKLKEV